MSPRSHRRGSSGGNNEGSSAKLNPSEVFTRVVYPAITKARDLATDPKLHPFISKLYQTFEELDQNDSTAVAQLIREISTNYEMINTDTSKMSSKTNLEDTVLAQTGNLEYGTVKNIRRKEKALSSKPETKPALSADIGKTATSAFLYNRWKSKHIHEDVAKITIKD
jgi:hypothetical protein